MQQEEAAEADKDQVLEQVRLATMAMSLGQDDLADTTTTSVGEHYVFTQARRLVPSLSERDVIAQFAGTRATIEGDDFEIGHSEAPGFVNVAGIQSPGLTAAPAIARYVADLLHHDGLELSPKPELNTIERPIHFAFTHDEEIGCLGARNLMEELRRLPFRPSVAIIGEPTEMRLIEGHKGCYEYSVEFTGLEGHGSLPDQGVNAVEYAVRYVGRLMELRETLRERAPKESRFDPPWTTLQVGRLSGGVAHNIIPGHCTLDWELRPVSKDDGEFVKAEIAAFVDEVLRPDMKTVSSGANIVTEVLGEVDGLEPLPDSEAVRLVAELTGANRADVVAFGTEAGLFQGLGISTVVCGPGSIEQAHKPDEYVTCSQLELALAMLARLVPKLEAS